MNAEEFFKHRYQKRIGDKHDLRIQQFDAHDMMDFAEAYAQQQQSWIPVEDVVSEEEIEKVLIEQCSPDMRTYNPETKRAVFRILETDCDRAAKAIIQLIKREK